MDLKGKVATFSQAKTTVDIIDASTGQLVRQHDLEGTLYDGASMRKNIVAMAVSKPQHGVHVMDIESGKVLCKFILPCGQDARVALSEDTLTLAVGSNSGFS